MKDTIYSIYQLRQLNCVHSGLEDIENRYAVGYSHHMSFDMFWPFFAPNTQIGYHCKVTNEICGIFTTRAYLLQFGDLE